MAEETSSNSSFDNRRALSSSPRGDDSNREHPPPVAPNEQTVISKKQPIPAAAVPLPNFRPNDIGKALEGQQLGQFQLEEFVGGGGMGAVFRGVDTTLERIVAVKVVCTDRTDEDTLRRFRNEAQSAARLDHPNIARVYSVGEESDWNYIVFEFIEGVNVRDLVQHKGPLPIEESVSYLVQAAEALEHASQRDVVHRDIKPSNLLVMEDGRVKLVDMGLARLHQVDSMSNDITATGVTLGTFDYISPEQAHDPRNTDVRSDLYSLGCTFYYMLTGMPPFPEGTVLQKLLSHRGEEPPDPRGMRADVSPELSAVALKLMAKQPAQRFQTPGELITELASVCETLGLIMPSSRNVLVAAKNPWVSRVSYHLPWVVPLVLLFAIVFGVEAILPDTADVRREDLPPAFAAAPLDEPTAEPIAPIPESDLPPGETVIDNGDTERTPPAELATQPDQTETPERPSEPPPPTEPANTQPPLFEDSFAELSVKPTEAALELAPDALANISADKSETGENTPPSTPPTEREANTLPDAALADSVVRLIVFPDAPPTTQPDPMVVSSLEEAVRRLHDEPGISEMELRFDHHRAQPFTLDLRQDLTIKAADKYNPVIVFERDQSDLAGENRMINLLGGKLEIDGVHFQVKLPYGPGESALFYLNQVKEISLKNCSLTIQNDYRSDAAFFHVRRPRPSEMRRLGQDDLSPAKPSILLESCIARGQATLVRATDGLPFQLRFTEGFLATSERMVELGPLAESVLAEVARIRLQHVTALMQRGMCRVRLDENGARVPILDIHSENCLLDHNEDVPLIEHTGVRSIASTSNRLQLAGQHNAYPGTKICWRILPQANEPMSIPWDERTDEQHSWYAEEPSERYVEWSNGTPDQTPLMYDVTPDQYAAEDDVGFTSELPTLPDLAEMTSTDD